MVYGCLIVQKQHCSMGCVVPCRRMCFIWMIVFLYFVRWAMLCKRVIFPVSGSEMWCKNFSSITS